ncbi:pyridoxal-phosphate dependent enzyme [Candidatus Fermentibacteria bacterium]|nr:pyridoxal-phosphate dependent enzyme [Candidatus Fermentibacteria bacterium]
MGTGTLERRPNRIPISAGLHPGCLATPLADVTPETASGYRILAKIESLNPGLSVKDRVARRLVSGTLASWADETAPVLVEASSGNTAVSVAMAAQERGLQALLFVPEDASPVRVERMRAFGATVVPTPAGEGTGGARARALEAVSGRKGHVFLDQHGSDLNIEAHLLSTGPEVIAQLEGLVPDSLVLAVGTGGTLIGLREALEGRFPWMSVTGVVPATDRGIPGMRRIDAGSAPLHARLSDVPLEEVEAEEAAWWSGAIRRMTGIPVGPSSGAAMAAAVRIGKRSGGLVLTLFPDHGFNYV